MLPDYYDGLYLPAGKHECNWEEFENRFATNERRTQMARRLRGMLNRAKGCAFRKAIIFGSFVTGRENPADIDIIWITEPDLDRGTLPEGCRELLDSARSRERFNCDVFDCAENPVVLGFLLDTFGIDKRSQKPRGVVIIELAQL